MRRARPDLLQKLIYVFMCSCNQSMCSCARSMCSVITPFVPCVQSICSMCSVHVFLQLISHVFLISEPRPQCRVSRASSVRESACKHQQLQLEQYIHSLFFDYCKSVSLQQHDINNNIRVITGTVTITVHVPENVAS